MALFGRKKKNIEIEDITVEEQEEALEETEAPDDTEEEDAAEEEKELTPEEGFQQACQLLAGRVRAMFPKQMLIGFYYAELQSEGYIDDLCCYTTSAQKIEKSEIPSRCGMSLPDMVAREERLEQAFFRFRKAAIAYTEKECNAVAFTMINDGQVKIDITSEPLIDGEEEIRYGKWREMVDKTELRPAPKKLSEEKLKEIQQRAREYYQAMGTEFYSLLPDVDFKVAYFYAENNENGVFYHHRMIMNDGEIIDGEAMLERFDMDKEQVDAGRMEIVKQLMNIRQVFTDNNEQPFTNATLSVTAKGEFSSNLAFNPVSAATEQQRLEAWKEAHKE